MDRDLISVLKQSAMFSTHGDAELDELIRHGTSVSCQAGQELFREGDLGASLLIIVSGWVVLGRTTPGGRQIRIGKAGPGEVLGEMALLDPAPRSATATVLTPVRALEIPTSSFNDLLEELRPAGTKLLRQLTRVLCARLRGINLRIETELLEADLGGGGLGDAPGGGHSPYSSDLLNRGNMGAPFPDKMPLDSGARSWDSRESTPPRARENLFETSEHATDSSSEYSRVRRRVERLRPGPEGAYRSESTVRGPVHATGKASSHSVPSTRTGELEKPKRGGIWKTLWGIKE